MSVVASCHISGNILRHQAPSWDLPRGTDRKSPAGRGQHSYRALHENPGHQTGDEDPQTDARVLPEARALPDALCLGCEVSGQKEWWQFCAKPPSGQGQKNWRLVTHLLLEVDGNVFFVADWKYSLFCEEMNEMNYCMGSNSIVPLDSAERNQEMNSGAKRSFSDLRIETLWWQVCSPLVHRPVFKPCVCLVMCMPFLYRPVFKPCVCLVRCMPFLHRPVFKPCVCLVMCMPFLHRPVFKPCVCLVMCMPFLHRPVFKPYTVELDTYSDFVIYRQEPNKLSEEDLIKSLQDLKKWVALFCYLFWSGNHRKNGKKIVSQRDLPHDLWSVAGFDSVKIFFEKKSHVASRTVSSLTAAFECLNHTRIVLYPWWCDILIFVPSRPEKQSKWMNILGLLKVTLYNFKPLQSECSGFILSSGHNKRRKFFHVACKGTSSQKNVSHCLRGAVCILTEWRLRYFPDQFVSKIWAFLTLHCWNFSLPLFWVSLLLDHVLECVLFTENHENNALSHPFVSLQTWWRARWF